MDVESINREISLKLSHLVDEQTEDYVHFYRRRGWVFSFFALLFLAVPVYLFIRGVSHFSGWTFLDLFLCLLLAILWAGLPFLFVFLNSKGNRVKRYVAWGWVVLAAVSCVFWGIVLRNF